MDPDDGMGRREVCCGRPRSSDYLAGDEDERLPAKIGDDRNEGSHLLAERKQDEGEDDADSTERRGVTEHRDYLGHPDEMRPVKDPPLLDCVVPALNGTATVASDDGEAEHQGDDLQDNEGNDADYDGTPKTSVRRRCKFEGGTDEDRIVRGALTRC